MFAFWNKVKGKVDAGVNRSKLMKKTKSCQKTLERQFESCLDDNSESEVDEDQAYQSGYGGLNGVLYLCCFYFLF